MTIYSRGRPAGFPVKYAAGLFNDFELDLLRDGVIYKCAAGVLIRNAAPGDRVRPIFRNYLCVHTRIMYNA